MRMNQIKISSELICEGRVRQKRTEKAGSMQISKRENRRKKKRRRNKPRTRQPDNVIMPLAIILHACSTIGCKQFNC